MGVGHQNVSLLPLSQWGRLDCTSWCYSRLWLKQKCDVGGSEARGLVRPSARGVCVSEQAAQNPALHPRDLETGGRNTHILPQISVCR